MFQQTNSKYNESKVVQRTIVKECLQCEFNDILSRFYRAPRIGQVERRNKAERERKDENEQK